MRPLGSPEELERRRIRAISLLKQGKKPVEAAKMLGVERRSVRRWKASYKKDGEEGIQSIPSPGRPPKLNDQQLQTLGKDILKGAKACKFPTDLWTCPRVVQHIKRRFGITADLSRINRNPGGRDHGPAGASCI